MKDRIRTGLFTGMQISRFMIIAATCLVGGNLFSQDNQLKYSRQTAVEAFNNGDYELAYNEFEGLLHTFSRDPFYKYFSGICLVKLKRDPEKAEILLQQSLEGAAAVKPVPSDAWFYLGRAQQMYGNFADALKSYKFFVEHSAKKAAAKYDVSAYIQQCNERRGQIIKDEIKLAENVKKDAVELKPEVKNSATDKVKKPQEVPVEIQEVPVEIRKEELPADYEKVSAETILYQAKADSSIRKPEPSTLEVTNEKQARPPVSAKTDEVYSIFNINSKSVYTPDEKIAIDPELPGGLVYRIQLAVFRNPVVPSVFKGISPVNGFKMAATGNINYYAGMFRRLADARKAQEAVKQKGFKDAFIVAIFDRKPVSSERALFLENEWGDKPFNITRKPVPGTPGETIPPTLSFRVEVTRSAKPLKDDLVDNYKKLAGSRGFEIVTTDDNKLVYLIGIFITFVSASEYADLLVRNGYRDAKVTAWLGKKEIPVDTAKQLFEKLE